MDSNTREESDSLGLVEVPSNVLWGAQTQRSLKHFSIGRDFMHPRLIHAYALLKKSCCVVNLNNRLLTDEQARFIIQGIDKLLSKDHSSSFPLKVWQTGSGTQTNMNVNEVIANLANSIANKPLGSKHPIHPNDHVNLSQSSNDTFPTAMHIAAYAKLVEFTIPKIEGLKESLHAKSKAMCKIVKIGRTHWMDATPLTLGQEFSGYVSQIAHGLRSLRSTLPHLSELALGGTAVGTGLNTPAGYSDQVAEMISDVTGLPFVTAPNKFEALAANDAIVESHAALKQIAVSLHKIANDIRMLASGPRSGIGEISIPANEPGSSIMPGKVNPTQVEALTMVCAQVIGNDTTITFAGASGHFELNVYKPVMINAFLESANLLGSACHAFNHHCVIGIEPNRPRIQEHLQNSLMLVTALNPHIGYENATKIVKKAHAEKTTLREAAIELELLTAEQFDQWVDPAKMIGHETSQ